MARISTAVVSNDAVNHEPSTGPYPETVTHHGKVWLIAYLVRPS